MLSKKQRFPLREHRDVLPYSTYKHGTLVDLYLSPPQTNISQASVIVGKNVSLLSTRRNYIKRMVYEILRTRVLPTKEGVFIVRVKPKGKKITYENLAREMAHLTTRG